MTHPTADEKDYYMKRMSVLKGGKIVDVGMDDSNGYDGWLYLVAENKGKRYISWILSDEEGNSSGTLDIQEEKTNI